MRAARAKVFLAYVGANVRRLRLRAGKTQAQLAEGAGIEPRYLQEIERAKTNVSLAVLVAVADALGVDPRALLRPASLSRNAVGRPPGRPERKTSKR